jgi:hypothetical protein
VKLVWIEVARLEYLLKLGNDFAPLQAPCFLVVENGTVKSISESAIYQPFEKSRELYQTM